MWCFYHTLRLASTPFQKISQFIQNYVTEIVYLPSLALTVIMIISFFRVKYESLFSAVGYAFLYIIFGSIAISVLNLASGIIALVLKWVAGIFTFIYQWTREMEEASPKKPNSKKEKKMEKEREEQEAFYRAMTEERGYTMCYDPSLKKS